MVDKGIVVVTSPDAKITVSVPKNSAGDVPNQITLSNVTGEHITVITTSTE